jgi:hypothetical protein
MNAKARIAALPNLTSHASTLTGETGGIRRALQLTEEMLARAKVNKGGGPYRPTRAN